MRGGENQVEGGDMQGFFGARWWRFDFHTHTPASTDYGKCPYQTALREITPEEWLLNVMKARLDEVLETVYSPAIGLILCRKSDWADHANCFGAALYIVASHMKEVA